MKAVWIALILLVISFALVITNSVFLCRIFDNIYDDIEKAHESDTEILAEKYQEIFDYYKKNISYIALSVKHSELLDIENSFSELISACLADSASDIAQIKSRLMNELSHTRRLIGFNIDSIL